MIPSFAMYKDIWERTIQGAQDEMHASQSHLPKLSINLQGGCYNNYVTFSNHQRWVIDSLYLLLIIYFTLTYVGIVPIAPPNGIS